MNKIKVIWICHFTNVDVQAKLPIWKTQNEFAPWIPNLIKGFESRDDIELHIVSPHDYLKKQTSYIQKGVHYHFIPYGIPFIHRHWPDIFLFDVFTNFKIFRKRVESLVEKIKPDLINLMGTENAYYSSSVLSLKHKYPILIVIQGFISQMKAELKLNIAQNKRIEIEEKLLKSFMYYAGEQDSSNYISTYNNKHVFYRVYYPVNEDMISEIKLEKYKYDCVFFGRLSKEKGVDDFIRTIAEIKKKKPDVRACIIGGGDEQPYLSLAIELNCSGNIEFVGFLDTQKELFEYVKASKLFLVTPFFERLSSTIREAMFLKVPIIAYATGGIPYINEYDENIYLVKTGDYHELARKALLLLENEIMRNNLAEKSFQYANEEFSLNVNVGRLISAYRDVLLAYNN